MAKYRQALPQLCGEFFLTDGGLETTLIFLDGQDLPLFAAFDLFKTPEGEGALRKYFRTYAELAQRHRSGLLLETPTWRANTDWGDKLSYSKDALAEANKKCVRLLEVIRDEYEKTVRQILDIAELDSLLEENPTLALSLKRRSPYLNPLNHIAL